MTNIVLRGRARLREVLSKRQYFVLMWLLRAVAASLFFAFISNLATLAYAIRYGARPPVEGVPYLSLTVGFFGFLVVILTITVIYLMPFLVRQLRALSENVIKWTVTRLVGKLSDAEPDAPKESTTAGPWDTTASPTKLTRQKRRRTLLYWGSNALSAVFVVLAGVVASGLSEFFSSYWQAAAIEVLLPLHWNEGPLGAATTIFAITFSIALLFQMLSILSDKTLSIISNVVYILSLLGIVVLCIWSPVSYLSFENLLRFSRFGGGVPIDIKMADGENIRGKYLFLTSQNAITVYDDAAGTFRELTKEQVSELTYRSEDGWVLPAGRNWASTLSDGRK